MSAYVGGRNPLASQLRMPEVMGSADMTVV
jgi:hypothetical protein